MSARRRPWTRPVACSAAPTGERPIFTGVDFVTSITGISRVGAAAILAQTGDPRRSPLPAHLLNTPAWHQAAGVLFRSCWPLCGRLRDAFLTYVHALGELGSRESESLAYLGEPVVTGPTGLRHPRRCLGGGLNGCELTRHFDHERADKLIASM
jgi:hypothetical protein